MVDGTMWCSILPMVLISPHYFSPSTIIQLLISSTGLIGETDWDQARGDMISDYVDDMRTPLMKIHFEPDESKKVFCMV